MQFFNSLLNRTPSDTDQPPSITLTTEALAHGVDIIIGDIDEVESLPEGKEIARRYTLEPYFWMIEYTDAHGTMTRRRVTMRHIEDRRGIRYLTAICHERRAPRVFRLDRIGCLISQDGEIERAGPWFDEILSISEYEDVIVTPWPDPRKNTTRQPEVSPYTALRRATAPSVTVLLAAARSDDILHPRELDAIVRHIEDEAFILRDAGIIPDIDAEMLDKMERTIRRLRPTREDLTNAFTELAGWDRAQKRRLAHALAATAEADGRVDDIEAQLISELTDLGTRKFGHGWSD